MTKRVRADALHRKWMKDPDYRAAYGELEGEFALATAMIAARSRAGLTQTALARRMKTTQTVIARLEGGRAKPSTRTLERFARATGSRLKISFEPASWRRPAAAPAGRAPASRR
jgi:ribosome-binding protein aMBF1 (putative translation factor)